MFNEPQIRSDVLLDYPVRTLRSSSTILTFVLSAQLTSSPICQGQSPPVLIPPSQNVVVFVVFYDNTGTGTHIYDTRRRRNFSGIPVTKKINSE